MNDLSRVGGLGPAQEGLAEQGFLSATTDLRLDPFNYGFTTGFMNADNLTYAAINQSQRFIDNFRDKDLTAQEAKAKYNIDSDGPISNEYAKYKYDQQQKRLQRDLILSNLDSNKFGSSAYPILGGFAGGMADPAGLLLGAGIARAAVSGASLFQGTKAAQSIISAYQSSRSLGTALKAGAIQGGLESIVSTPAMLYDQSTTFDYDPTAEDAIVDVATNIIGGSAFEGLGYGFGKFLKKFSSKQQEDLVGTALTLAHEGKNFDYGDLQKAYIKDVLLPREGEAAPINSQYVVGGFDNGEFYASFNTKVPNIVDLNTNNVIDYSYGDGLILTDNPNFASRAAAKAYTGEEGSTVRVKINTEKLADTTQAPDVRVELAIRKTLSKYFDESEVDTIVGSKYKGSKKDIKAEYEMMAPQIEEARKLLSNLTEDQTNTVIEMGYIDPVNFILLSDSKSLVPSKGTDLENLFYNLTASQQALSKLGLGGELAIPQRELVDGVNSLRKILDNVDRYQITEDRDIDFQNEINNEISSLGFEGYRFEGGLSDIASTKHNSVFLFDPRKATALPGSETRVKLDTKTKINPEIAQDAKGLLEQFRSDAIEVGYNRRVSKEMEGFPPMPPGLEPIELGADIIYMGYDKDSFLDGEGVPEAIIPPVIMAEIESLPEVPGLKDYMIKDFKTILEQGAKIAELDKNSDTVFKAAEFCTRNNP